MFGDGISVMEVNKSGSCCVILEYYVLGVLDVYEEVVEVYSEDETEVHYRSGKWIIVCAVGTSPLYMVIYNRNFGHRYGHCPFLRLSWSWFPLMYLYHLLCELGWCWWLCIGGSGLGVWADYMRYRPNLCWSWGIHSPGMLTLALYSSINFHSCLIQHSWSCTRCA